MGDLIIGEVELKCIDLKLSTETFLDLGSLPVYNEGETETRPTCIRTVQVLDIFVSLLLPAVEEMGDPYTLKPCVSGVRGYPPKIIAITAALCEYSNAGYRRTYSLVRGNHTLPAKPGLSSIPAKSTIGAAYKNMPKDCLSRLNDILVESIEVKSVAWDSTAMSNDRKPAWLSVRTAGKKDKKGWIKIHTLIGIKAISKVAITKGTADAPPMTEILKSLEGLKSEINKGYATFDSAYLGGNSARS